MKTLKSFAKWYLEVEGRILIQSPVENAIRVTHNFSELILYRDSPFQVTLIILFPMKRILPHYHPNVDAYNINVTGNGESIVAGRSWTKYIQGPLTISRRIPVLAGAIHHGMSPKGTSFLSIQKWKNNTSPGFLADDWTDSEERS